MSQIDAAIDAGDIRAILREWAKAERAESESRFCACAEPDLTGRKSHLCFGCGLYNLARKAEIEAAMAGPHAFEPMGPPPVKHRYCGFCSMLADDTRHGPVTIGGPS